MDRSIERGYLESGDGERVGSLTQANIFGTGKDANYEKYENPKVFGSYQVFLLGLDFLFNLAVDCAYGEPLVILVCFMLQSLVLIINLILYIMTSANQAMQTGLKQRTVRHHEANIVTCITYMILTAWWYIWALRRSWPSVSDQFSFSFSQSDTNTPNESMAIMPGSNSQHNQHRNGTFAKGGATTKDSGLHQTSDPHSEIFTLWSPGFLALYSVQRTVAVIHYIVYMKATFIVLNSSILDKYDDYEASASRETVVSHVNPAFHKGDEDRIANDGNVMYSESNEDSEEDESHHANEINVSRKETTTKSTALSKPSIARRTNLKGKLNDSQSPATTATRKNQRDSPRLQRDGADGDSPYAHSHAVPNKTSSHKKSTSNKSKRLTKKNRSQSEDFYEDVSDEEEHERY